MKEYSMVRLATTVARMKPLLPLFMKLGLVVGIVIFVTMLLVTLKVDIGENLTSYVRFDVSGSVRYYQDHYNSTLVHRLHTSSSSSNSSSVILHHHSHSDSVKLKNVTTNAKGSSQSETYLKNKSKSNASIGAGLIIPVKEDTISECGNVKCQPTQVCFKDSGEFICQDRSDVVHLIMLADIGVFPGLITTLHSIMNNTRTNLKLYVITNSQDYAEIKSQIDCIPLSSNIMSVVIKFNLPQEIKDLIKIYDSHKGYLKSTENFARLFVANLLPLDYALYVDCDTIIQEDLGVLWRELYLTEPLMAAATYDNGEKFVDSKLFVRTHVLYEKRYGRNASNEAITINNGVLGMNLKKWRDNDVFDDVIFWMSANKKQHLWDLGSQPIMNMLVIDDLKTIDEKWNYRMRQRPFIDDAKLYHLNGKCKPWKDCKMRQRELIWRELRDQYDKGVCSGRGKCVLKKKEGICECTSDDYYGRYCEKSRT